MLVLVRNSPVRLSHILVILSQLTVAAWRPSGLNVAKATPYSCGSSTGNDCPSRTSQMNAAFASDTVSTRCPSGLKSADRTEPLWYSGSLRGRPDCASQTRAVLSLEAV